MNKPNAPIKPRSNDELRQDSVEIRRCKSVASEGTGTLAAQRLPAKVVDALKKGVGK